MLVLLSAALVRSSATISQVDRVVAPLELKKLYKELAALENVPLVPEVPKPKKYNPAWKNIEAFNRKRYAEKMRKEVEEMRRGI